MNNKFIYLCLTIVLFLTACTDKTVENQMSYEYETSHETDTTEDNTTQTTDLLENDADSFITTDSVSTRKVTVKTVEKKNPPDGELVRILDYIPDAVIDLRYATTNNFTGTVIYDDNDNEARLCYGTVKKLAKVQNELKEKGYSIIIWDAYRSSEAQYKLWEVCPDPTYVADPEKGGSSHNKGNTIDLGIVYTDGSKVELPSDFDEFSLLADREYSDVSAKAAENSNMLEEIMNKYGFNGYWGEWWHYSDEDIYTLIIPEN